MTRSEILQTAKPILFGTEMVRAIQDGRKTVTRRPVKPKSPKACGFYVVRDSKGNFMDVYDYDENEAMFESPQARLHIDDILYVRETWAELETVYDDLYYAYKADDDILHHSIGENFTHWSPSIHMPKEAARIFLQVTGVRVERLQDITKDGIIAEGAETDEYLDYEEWATAVAPPGSRMITLRDYFSELWNSTVKKSDIDKYGWDANQIGRAHV